MKKSYAIPSMYLDRLEATRNLAIEVTTGELVTVAKAGEEDNLFDYPKRRRKVEALTLLAEKDLAGFDKLSAHMNGCHELYVMNDFHTDIPIVWSLYIKRLYQAMKLLEEQHPQLHITLVLHEEV